MKKSLTIACLLFQIAVFSQITIDIHPNFKHTVGDIDTFNRKRMLKIHADQVEPDWTTGNNFGNFGDLRDSFLNGYDVYMGRNTGVISWYSNQVNEDPNRPGFADPEHIESLGQAVRNGYASQTLLHPYEERNELVIAAQQHPFYPDGTLTGQGWAFTNGTATGEYMGRFVNAFHGADGQPKPTYIEIMNEPLYEFVTVGNLTPLEIFNFHNEAADAIRAQVPDIPIGGYCAAFPNFEVDNFQRWHDRWKLFMDTSGDRMDFWSIHFYDFNLDWNNVRRLRKGSNLEATMDMIDHYSFLSFNEIKPYVISEYGGRALTMESQPWSPLRDWHTLKSWTSMLLTFSERPQDILSAIPFVIVKATWGTQANGNPYPWRLMRQNHELTGETGFHWVYTDMVKFYQLWSDVKGTRIDTRSTNPDIQCNAFINGDKMYLVLNNLYFNDTTIHLNVIEHQGNSIQNIQIKHLYLNAAGDAPVLDDLNYTSLDSIIIEAEGAMVIEYTFQDEVSINEHVEETKYFADTYLTPITPFTDHIFNINGVDLGIQGEAVLRLGMGRAHSKSLQPSVKVNGFMVQVPSNYMGYDQLTRETWFGVIEVPIPYYYLRANNEISVRFEDTGGYISTMALRVYNHSNEVFRSDSVSLTGLSLLPEMKFMLPDTDFQLITELTPVNVTDATLIWSSSDDNIASVDAYGKVSAHNYGSVMISATALNGGLSDTSFIEVVDSIPYVSIFGLDLQPQTISLHPNEAFPMQVIISPPDATDQSITWEVIDSLIATVSASGVVTANLAGTTAIIATTVDGGYSDTSYATVNPNFATSVFCSLLPDLIEQDTSYDLSFAYSSGYNCDILVELRDAENNILGQGQTSGSPGFGNVANINLIATVVPPVGNDYSFHVFINAAGLDSTLFSCVLENVVVSAPVSTNMVEMNDFSIYPNPSDGILTVEIPHFTKPLHLSVFNMMGLLIHTQQIRKQVSQIDLRTAPSGVYLLKMESDYGTVLKRIVLN